MSKPTLKSLRRMAIALVVSTVAATSAHAQWLKLPLPGTPRLPDGTPNLRAPAPKMPDGTPDFSGIWGKP